MATASEIWNMIQSGADANAARKERNYLNERRAVEDPYNDAELARKDAARAAVVQDYGVKAGDPTVYGQVEGIEQRREMHPLTVQTTQNELADAQRARAVQAAKAGLTGLTQYGGEDPSAFLQGPGRGTPKAIADALGLEADAVAAELSGNPKAAAMFTEMLLAGADPETVKQVIEGSDAFYTVGNRGTVKSTGVKPSQGSASSARYVQNANGIVFDKMTGQTVVDPNIIAAVTGAGGTGQYAKTVATETAKEDVQKPAQQQAREVLQADIADMRALLLAGGERGAFPSEKQGTAQRAGAVAATSIPGAEFVQRIADPETQRIRDEIQNIVPRVANKIMQASNMGVRMLDTEKEYERFIAQINKAGATLEAQLAALDRLERAMLKDSERPAAAPASGLSERASRYLNE